jgi:hypothetical protein
MTVTQYPDVALPDGADLTHMDDEWESAEDGRLAYRCVWSKSFDDSPDADIRAVVIQFDDGTIATDGADAPLVYIHGSDYLPEDARKIAEAIVRAANLADQWAGVQR